jgi:hypothetical protein
MVFPNSIDKLNKEISPDNGPKPVVFELGSDLAIMEKFLFNILANCSETPNAHSFGSNQVIIVKNQYAKKS